MYAKRNLSTGNVEIGSNTASIKGNENTTYFGLRHGRLLATVAVAGFLGGLVTAQPQLPKRMYNEAKALAINTATNISYGEDVTGRKFRIKDYTTKSGDKLDILAHGDRVLTDYLRDRYKIEDPGKLQPGTKIELPVEINSPDGKSLFQIIREWRESKPETREHVGSSP